jgi:hypothetical protein
MDDPDRDLGMAVEGVDQVDIGGAPFVVRADRDGDEIRLWRSCMARNIAKASASSMSLIISVSKMTLGGALAEAAAAGASKALAVAQPASIAAMPGNTAQNLGFIGMDGRPGIAESNKALSPVIK